MTEDRPASEVPTQPPTRVPETGDVDVDQVLHALAVVPAEDLDAQLSAGEEVQRTLRARLADLDG